MDDNDDLSRALKKLSELEEELGVALINIQEHHKKLKSSNYPIDLYIEGIRIGHFMKLSLDKEFYEAIIEGLTERD